MLFLECLWQVYTDITVMHKPIYMSHKKFIGGGFPSLKKKRGSCALHSLLVLSPSPVILNSEFSSSSENTVIIG